MLLLFDLNRFIYFLYNNQAFFLDGSRYFIIAIFHSGPQRHIIFLYERSILLTLLLLSLILL